MFTVEKTARARLAITPFSATPLTTGLLTGRRLALEPATHRVERLLGGFDEFLYLGLLLMLLELLHPALDNLLAALTEFLSEWVFLDDEFLLDVSDVFQCVGDVGDLQVPLLHRLPVRELRDGLESVEGFDGRQYLFRSRLGELLAGGRLPPPHLFGLLLWLADTPGLLRSALLIRFGLLRSALLIRFGLLRSFLPLLILSGLSWFLLLSILSLSRLLLVVGHGLSFARGFAFEGREMAIGISSYSGNRPSARSVRLLGNRAFSRRFGRSFSSARFLCPSFQITTGTLATTGEDKIPLYTNLELWLLLYSNHFDTRRWHVDRGLERGSRTAITIRRSTSCSNSSTDC
ncbi:hypothetical protein [Natrinema caseinilyticum]|uniref:hypothetical protein n=1 Tax=Natrinema caseinilyticum TaxID=2961570 RepID=UPI0020C27BB2|nr:hypothetical protein [Natrinema caseinilyticum]